MNIDKDQILKLLRSQGQHDQVGRRAAGQGRHRQCPARRDAVEVGIDPASITDKLGSIGKYMTSTTERYSAAAGQSASTAEKIADFWTQGAQRLSDYMLPGLPQVDLIPVVERYFEFVQRTVDISRDLTLKWAEAAGTLSGAVREQAESVGGLVREQAQSARDFAHEQAGQAEQAAREQAGQARRAE